MRIEYYIPSGDRVAYETYGDTVTMEDIDFLAMFYYEKVGTMPNFVFMTPDVYRGFMLGMGTRPTYHAQDQTGGYTTVAFHTAIGVINFKMVTDPKYKFVMVGCENDYEQSRIDKHFEHIVLNGSN